MPYDQQGNPRSGGGRMNFANKGGEKSTAPVQKEAGGEESIEDVVAQHGPADAIEMKHNDGASEHHVTSHHAGHMHKSMHGSRSEAHAHAKKAAGVSDEQSSGGDPGMAQQDVSNMC
jgi:hypothetical protein